MTITMIAPDLDLLELKNPENKYGGYTIEEIVLIEKASALYGNVPVGRLLCLIDPEVGCIDLQCDVKEQSNQSSRRDHWDKEWNFLFPAYVNSCVCYDTEFLQMVETEYVRVEPDGELQEVPVEDPPRFFGHSLHCLSQVRDFISSRDSILELYSTVTDPSHQAPLSLTKDERVYFLDNLICDSTKNRESLKFIISKYEEQYV